MIKHLQTVYVPCDNDNVAVGIFIGQSDNDCVVGQRSAYLYSPEEHARVEKMREALERIMKGTPTMPIQEAAHIAVKALNP